MRVTKLTRSNIYNYVRSTYFPGEKRSCRTINSISAVVTYICNLLSENRLQLEYREDGTINTIYSLDKYMTIDTTNNKIVLLL